jgi:hypothetical protein
MDMERSQITNRITPYKRVLLTFLKIPAEGYSTMETMEEGSGWVWIMKSRWVSRRIFDEGDHL